MEGKRVKSQMFREMKAICGCNRLRNTETKIILNEDSQRDAQRAKHSNHAFAFGNIDSDCVHTSSCIQIATAIPAFPIADSICLLTRTHRLGGGSTCTKRTL